MTLPAGVEPARIGAYFLSVLREIVDSVVAALLSVLTLLPSFILFLRGRQRKALHDPDQPLV